jgi:hypothetical protein
MRQDGRNEAGEMNGVMLKGVDLRLLCLKLLWMICQNGLFDVARDDDGDAWIRLLRPTVVGWARWGDA